RAAVVAGHARGDLGAAGPGGALAEAGFVAEAGAGRIVLELHAAAVGPGDGVVEALRGRGQVAEALERAVDPVRQRKIGAGGVDAHRDMQRWAPLAPMPQRLSACPRRGQWG